jgi:phospholipid/cholesterol/gamma-HCH transport system substrate-binding protein
VNGDRRNRGVQLRVGVFVIVALAAFLGMIYALGARARLFEPRYTIHADFAEVGGLTEGATVRLAGVQIGRVTGVHLPSEPGGKVRVDLTIARRYQDRVRQNSVARIETQGLLGDKIVEIGVGTTAAAMVPPDGTLPAREAADITQVINESAATVKDVAAIATSLRQTAEAFNQTQIVKDLAAVTSSARQTTDQLARITGEVEKGRGWAHALIYEEPVALRRLNGLIAGTEKVLNQIDRGEGAIGVLLSRQSSDSAKRFLAAMDRISALTDAPRADGGLLPALLFDPKYKALLEDLRTVSRNLREVSDRVAGGRGTLGSLVKDEQDDGGLKLAIRDLQASVKNLKAITDKINSGEGTLGALIADPTIYDRLAAILDGAQRSVILRSLIRGLGKDGKGAKE